MRWLELGTSVAYKNISLVAGVKKFRIAKKKFYVW
jgi:hypothetical protein